MKSLDKKKPKKLDWEKEFDKLNLGYDDSSIQCYFINGKGVDIVVKDFIKQTLTQQRTELFNDLIKIADSGEFEDMRRELNIYFKGKDE